MKLYLSSYHFGDHKADLVRMLTGNKRAGVISNAGDVFAEDGKTAYMRAELIELGDMAIAGEALDLRDYFGRTAELKKKIDSLNMLWVTGGNTFVLRRAMKQSGLDLLLQGKSKDKDFVYAGYSAGVCVITPTLHGVELVDDPHAVPQGYDGEIIWDGLNIVPYCVAPHFKSDHPESAAVNTQVAYYEQHNMPYKTLRDGEVILSET